MSYRFKKYKIKPKYYNDFYNSINYKWLNKNKIPKDQLTYNIFTQLQTKINNKLKKIIKSNKYPKITKIYNSYLDINYRNTNSLVELKDIIKIVDNINTYDDLTIISSKLLFINVSVLYDLNIDINMYNSNEYILYLTQSNLILPDKSYYLDNKYNNIRIKYINTIKKIYKYIYSDLDKKDISKIANIIIDIETNLAKIMLNNTDMRDVNSIYHELSLDNIRKEYKRLNIDNIINNIIILLDNDKIKFNNIMMEYLDDNNYFKRIENIIKNYKIEEWKRYYEFKIIMSFINLTDEKLNSIYFDMFKKTLRGQKKQQSNEKLSLSYTCSLMKDYISNIYYETIFDKSIKNYVIEMIDNIKLGVKDRITMSELFKKETKTKAIEKIDNMLVLLGYKESDKEYDIKLSDSIIKNTILLIIKNNKFAFNKIMNNVERNKWDTSSYEVNAYYNSTKNIIVFPAAILQSSFINLNKSDIYNYARFGAVVGHEIIHGFDDNGSKFDKDGNLKSWWSKEDNKNFRIKVDEIIKIYNEEGINGTLTAGENIADFGAVIMSLQGLKNKLGRDLRKDELKEFYKQYASLWRYLINPTIIDEKILTDPHAFAELRVNIPLKHQPEFQYAFDIKPNHKMYVSKNNMFKIW
jgi:putative endopeptidase